jgi:GalNAc-alpha-(1->4)-GalNAc-alpha-(1->3)-diNAcBac-PP-undecaprenol alpha-1,4-N-acetyl-D-galactosaminyltransferase
MERKILCLVIPSLQPGGMERVMSELAGYFCLRKDLQVHLILYGREPEIFYNVADVLLVHRPKTTFNNKFRQLYALGRLFFLRKTIRKIKPHAVLSFGEYWNSFVLISLLGLSYPVFVSDRCSPEMEFGAFHRLLRKVSYRRAKGIIAQTEKAKGLYSIQLKNKNITVIGNPIRNIRVRNFTEQKENIVLTVGRLIRTKHHDRLIEIFSGISVPGWKLVIVGGDALKQNNMIRLKELIQKLGMNDRVILTGNQSEVDGYYLKSRIFAFASSSEGFPNVVGEAMSAGLAVVAFDCVAGPGELIENGRDGFLVPVFDFEMFRVKLEQLMSNEDIRVKLGRQAKNSIMNFSLNIIGGKYFNFIFNSVN